MRVPEVVEGYPDRILPKDEAAAAATEERVPSRTSITSGPPGLITLIATLDEAVAEAYGWAPDIPDEDVLRCLLALNHTRAHTQSLPRADATQSKQEALSRFDQ